MPRPLRTWFGALPTRVRGGRPLPATAASGEDASEVTRSWQGIGSARRSTPGGTSGSQLTLACLPTLVLIGIVTTLVGSGAAVALLPPVPPELMGRLPQPAAVAARTGDIDPEAPPPRRVTIERLGIDSTLVGLGVQRDGTLQVPDDVAVAGWHRAGTAPGDIGPAVVVGHVDSYRGPAVFYRLRELQQGDVVTVTRVDGSQERFEVYAQETVRKDAFPTDRVYGRTEGPELRLLTCGGAFDREADSYQDNVVVYARHLDEPVAS